MIKFQSGCINILLLLGLCGKSFEAGNAGKNDSIRPFLLDINVTSSWPNGDRGLEKRDARRQREQAGQFYSINFYSLTVL